MSKPKKPARPLIDPEISREAQARADADHRGNLTAYVNFLIRQDLRKSHQANRKK